MQKKPNAASPKGSPKESEEKNMDKKTEIYVAAAERRLAEIKGKIAENEKTTEEIYRKAAADGRRVDIAEVRPLFCEAEKLRFEALTVKAIAIRPGDTVSISPYTDWESYDVVDRTAKTLTCRRRRQGAFKAGWTNGEMSSESDPDGSIIKLHWSEKRGWWSYGKYHRVALGTRDYRDPSF